MTFQKGHKSYHTKESRKKISDNNSRFWKGKKLSKETKIKISNSLKGKIPKVFTKEEKKKISEKISKALKGRKCIWVSIRNKNNNPSKKGEEHYNYKKDRSTLAKKQERNDSAYKEWRKEVWLRDNFKCKIGNPDCLGKIEAHHILGWSSHPELRYQINNGITLCHFHHPRKREEEKRLIPTFKEIVASMSVSKD